MRSGFSEAALTLLLDAHGFLIYELATPADIQARYFDPCRPRLRAFEHTNFVTAALDRR